jgi:uncharacterized protein (TIGR03083 family)
MRWMSGAGIDIWERIRSNRLALADRLETSSDAEANSPSWCAGWRVRDVLGHLVHLAEATRASMLRDGLRAGTPNRTLDTAARRLGERPVPELCDRLRRAADGRFRLPGVPRAVGLGEVIVHGNDALRPNGSTFDPDPDDLRAVLDAYSRLARLTFRTTAPILGGRGAFPRIRRVRLVATDLDWSVGQGAEIHGKAVDLALLLANRRKVLPSLVGEGQEILAQDEVKPS